MRISPEFSRQTAAIAAIVIVLSVLSISSIRLGAAEVFGPAPSPRPAAIPLSTPSDETRATQPYAGPHREFVKSLQPLPAIPSPVAPRLWEPAEMSIGPLVASLEDVRAISVRTGGGEAIRTVSTGQVLEGGDLFQTGEHGNVRLAFEKGIQLLVPPGAVVKVGEEDIAGPGGGLEVPMIELSQGEVRVLVDGTKSETDAHHGPAPLKLLLRTKHAVFGVRGTDFMVHALEDHVELYVVSGVVEFGRDARAIGTAKSEKIAPSEMVEVYAARPLPKAEHYEAGMRLKDFHEKYPRLEELWNTAVRDAKSRRLVQQFLQLKTAKADAQNLKNGFAPAAVRQEAERQAAEAKRWKLREEGRQEEGMKKKTDSKPRKRRRRYVDPDDDIFAPAH